MNTIWSQIIYEKLGKTNVEIHKYSSTELIPYFKEWIEKSSKEEILKTFEIFGLNFKLNTDYYDGNFHEIYTSENNNICIHDVNVLPIVIQFFINFPDLIQDIELIKTIVEEYNKK